MSCSFRKQMCQWGSAIILASAPFVSLASPPVDVPQAAPNFLQALSHGPEDLEVKATGENTYSVRKNAKAEHDKTCTQSGDARFVPSFKDGKAVGFKLFAVRPGSIYAKLGFQERDVVQSINGITLETPEKALEAYAQLDTAKRVVVAIDRGGTVIRKTYDVAR
ncbi:general secretion pathway protein C [Myxococcus fulvus]|uniref:General secretion pathway protein C n=1 Tax=Myxococcus fulvus TaxID=33 RepID=A0A511T9C6_MYXFU|nr:hypothetical protein [Myxococcus fulvus]GEN10785.1 hypothetical protein MFU01_58220 [Myxococcus fulvus]SEU37614.1 general secretion pathway protein C [Myxococcus fulvus]